MQLIVEIPQKKKSTKILLKITRPFFNYLLVVLLYRCRFLPFGMFLRSCSYEVQSPRVTGLIKWNYN